VTNGVFKTTVSTLASAIDGLNPKQPTSEKGQANGYAGLDSGGVVPLSQLPATLPETALRAGLRASLTTESTDANNLTTTGTYVLNGGAAANSPSAHYYYVQVFGGANIGQ